MSMKFSMVAAVMCGAAMAIAPSANAGMMQGLTAPVITGAIQKNQFKLPIGMSAERTRRQLERDGYDEIDVTYVGILDAKADACRKGTRYRVKLRIDGTYEYRKEIGRCRRQIDEKQLRAMLRDKGYRRIDVNEAAPGSRAAFTATACQKGDRFELDVNEYGDIERNRNIGRCERELLSPREVRAALRKDGFDRIKFIDRTPPRYVIEACRKNRRIRLDINRRGRIRDRERIGRCSPRIDPKDLEQIVARNGYDRIDVVDRKGPRYRVEGCKGNERMRMVISPWGDRIAERKIGDCAPPITLAELEERLEEHPEKRFRNVRVREEKNAQFPYIARACVDGKRYDLYFTKWGQYGERKTVPGNCRSPRLTKIMEDMRDKGMRRLRTFVEGCQQGRLVRLQVDEYGEQLSRDVLGRCRRDRR